MPAKKYHVVIALLLALACAMASIFSGCGPQDVPEEGLTAPSLSEEETLPGYHRITAQQAKQRMDSGEPYILLDVRSQVEHNLEHIEGDLLIPHREIEEKAPQLLPDKHQTILIYCASGVRSKTAAETLLRLGYTDVYDFGAITDWPYGVVTEK